MYQSKTKLVEGKADDTITLSFCIVYNISLLSTIVGIIKGFVCNKTQHLFLDLICCHCFLVNSLIHHNQNIKYIIY